VKVVFINYCYSIDKFVKLSKKLNELYRYKGIYFNKRNLFLQSYLKKDPSHKEEDLDNNPSLFKDPILKIGLLSWKTLNVAALDTEINEIQDKLIKYE